MPRRSGQYSYGGYSSGYGPRTAGDKVSNLLYGRPGGSGRGAIDLVSQFVQNRSIEQEEQKRRALNNMDNAMARVSAGKIKADHPSVLRALNRAKKYDSNATELARATIEGSGKLTSENVMQEWVDHQDRNRMFLPSENIQTFLEGQPARAPLLAAASAKQGIEIPDNPEMAKILDKRRKETLAGQIGSLSARAAYMKAGDMEGWEEVQNAADTMRAQDKQDALEVAESTRRGTVLGEFDDYLVEMAKYKEARVASVHDDWADRRDDILALHDGVAPSPTDEKSTPQQRIAYGEYANQMKQIGVEPERPKGVDEYLDDFTKNPETLAALRQKYEVLQSVQNEAHIIVRNTTAQMEGAFTPEEIKATEKYLSEAVAEGDNEKLQEGLEDVAEVAKERASAKPENQPYGGPPPKAEETDVFETYRELGEGEQPAPTGSFQFPLPRRGSEGYHKDAPGVPIKTGKRRRTRYRTGRNKGNP